MGRSFAQGDFLFRCYCSSGTAAAHTVWSRTPYFEFSCQFVTRRFDLIPAPSLRLLWFHFFPPPTFFLWWWWSGWGGRWSGLGGGGREFVSSSDKNTQCRHARHGRPHQTEQTAITLATALFALHFDTHLCVMWRLRPKPFKCPCAPLPLALLGFIILCLQQSEFQQKNY